MLILVFAASFILGLLTNLILKKTKSNFNGVILTIDLNRKEKEN